MSARVRRLLALLAVLGLLAAACGNSGDDEPDAAEEPSGEPSGEVVSLDVPGVTDDEIRYAAFGTNSNNPLGTCVLDCFVDGIEAYFAWRNSEGGVHGRRLVLEDVLDDELSKNQQRAIEITSANDAFGAFSATQIASGWKVIADAGMPLYTWNIHPVESQHEAIFSGTGVICIDCDTRTSAYITTLAGVKKVASLGYGISENSKRAAGTTRDTLEHFGDDIGNPEVVYFNDDLAFGLPNGIAPEVTAMKQAGVEFIFATIDLNGMKTLAQELERQGMGDIPMYHPNTYNQQFITDAGDLFEGDYVSVQFRPFEAESAGSDLERFEEWMDETGSEITELAMNGWIAAAVAYDGLVAAGPEFDRAKVIDATNALEDYTAGGLVPPIDFGRQHQPATPDNPAEHGAVPECVVLLQVVDGKLTVVGGKPDAPWLCWPVGNEPNTWSEPEPTNFE